MRRHAATHGQNLAMLVDMRQWPIYAFPQLPCLRLTVPDMDFPPRVDDLKHIFLGPMIRRAGARQEDADLLADIDQFLAAQPADAPILLMSFGSIVTMPRHLRTAIKAVESRPVTLLVAAGKATESISREPTPPNVFIAKWLPLAHLLPAAKVAICHGGAATIHECIDALVPMLIYSTRSLDGDGNSARIAGLGLGIQGQEEDSADDMWRHIAHLLREPGFRSRCAAVQRQFERLGKSSGIESALRQCVDASGSCGQ